MRAQYQYNSRLDANLVLGALPERAAALIRPHVHTQDFAKATVLWDADKPSRLIYFPFSGLVSITCVRPEDSGIEVGFVGREGAVGFCREADQLTRGTVQVAGTFLSLLADRFWTLAADNAELRTLAACCGDWLLLQARGLAACNTIHDVQARLCRWLLQVSDRTGIEIPSTQEEIAQLLGVRRTTLTLIARKLQTTETISYRRGRIIVRDRAGLKELTCSCYHHMARMGSPSARMLNAYSLRHEPEVSAKT